MSTRSFSMAVVLLTILAPRPLLGGHFEIPHRQDRITIDADISDWQSDALEIPLIPETVRAPMANSGSFLLTWDPTNLYFAATITDNEVYPPPPTVDGARLYQWDSIEIYIDGHGNQSERMDEDDTQFIVSCDGRYGAMQGDEILRSVEDWEVPKRERLGLAAQTAARRTPTGYIVEGAFPLSAVDLAPASQNDTIAIDLAWNDWIEDHPRLPELLKDLENLALLTRHTSESAVQMVDPDSLGWDGLLEWEARAYRPHSLSNGPDFGHPRKWRKAVLVGGPPLSEALFERWGLVPLLAATCTVLLAIALAVDLRLRSRYRNNVRDLMQRIEILSTPPEATPTDPRDWVAKVADRLTGPPAATDPITSILTHICDHLQAPLSVTDLAAATGLSPRTLQRICQDELGAPPRDVILAVKMRTAQEALATGRWQVREVAEQVGFDSPYHFSRRFKDFYGQPPSAAIPPRQ